ncbi:MAG TPA: 2Fe-2S iron-sulfur cluster-binding protein [Alphaproteobacteria bacterium]|nr:2Fe-2S iron-sulfur cluster-binding protein [Alphaproteobacteria bacterium]
METPHRAQETPDRRADTMSFTVRVRQFDAPFTVATGETILDAALARELPYPHGCRSGNCGACKSELVSGEVEMSPYSEFALSEEEKSAGLVLACRAVPWSDCEVRFFEPDEVVAHPLRHMHARVVAHDDATHDIKRLRVEIVDGGPFSFTAGQYASLEFSGLPPRDYSMANRPDEPLLEFHIRLIPGGAVTPYVSQRLCAGEMLKVSGPYGTSYLREKHTGPIIALAGGSGLAPIKSIVEAALAQGMRQPIALYFGVRDERDLYFEEHFAALAKRHGNLTFIPVLSEPSESTRRRTGYLADAILRDFAAKGTLALDGAKAYLAGPPVMVETAMAALAVLGVRKNDCHADAFYTEADKAQRVAKY